ncbi:hypothetical protein ACIO6U_28290 [Streptomyces sp. NPDC087422]|uniref:hypothetical protein n=1 Tax=Streptomyces sp. NPDC087422 TaxID=3365786 RepID=UPI00381DBCFD
MQESNLDVTSQSRFAAFARTLDPSILSALRIDEATILGADLIVAICILFTDSNNPTPWTERVENYLETTGIEALDDGLTSVMEDIKDGKSKVWVEKYKNNTYREFTKRLLGAAQYRLLTNALKEDAAVVALALRRAVRAIMPFAVAWSDSTGILSKEQVRAKNKADLLAVNAVDAIITLDGIIGEKVLSSLPMEVTGATEVDLATWPKNGASDLILQFRAVVKQASAKRVERANSPLIRKIQGARAALEYSDDGTSQAANSLIELLDRIMREAFPPNSVLAWVDSNIPDNPDLTFFDENQNKRKPTKFGESLCFVYGGGPVIREKTKYDDGEGPTLVHEMIARTLVAVRNKLQQIKHADEGTPEERAQLLILFTALEGALMLGLFLGGPHLE